MSVDTTLAVLYAQSGLSTNVANAAMVAPQASLAMTRVLAAEEARQQQNQIAKSEKTDKPGINGDGERKTFFQSRKRRRHQRTEGDEALPTTAILGNLLNCKV